MRRGAFWAAVASPLLVLGAAFLIGGILHLFGASCVTYGGNPRECPRICVGMTELEGHAHYEGDAEQDRREGAARRR